MREDADYLRDMSDAISDIDRYTSLGRERFDQDELVQTFMIHRISIIGEAARSLTKGCRDRAPEIAWPDVVGMRNRLVHGYFEIDRALVWTAIQKDLPPLKAVIQRLLSLPGSTTQKEP